MNMKEIATGVQHIGVPTGDMDATIRFYHALGFDTIYETVNAEAEELLSSNFMTW